jgi:hypothetical protein
MTTKHIGPTVVKLSCVLVDRMADSAYESAKIAIQSGVTAFTDRAHWHIAVIPTDTHCCAVRLSRECATSTAASDNTPIRRTATNSRHYH